MGLLYAVLLLYLTVISCSARHIGDRSYKHPQPFTLIKKTAQDDSLQEVNFDEYPIVVPKRAALLLDRIMVALQKAVDDDSSISAKREPKLVRGNKTYWRCYFNAVSCF